MPREILALTIPNLSVFAKSLRHQLQQHSELPGHAKLLTMISKSAGFDNFQHLKATKPQVLQPAQVRRLDKALRVFDANGIMSRWPRQTAIQGLCLWIFWARLPARNDLGEREVNAILQSGHSFGDHALLRRSLIDHQLVTRTTDGRIYRRIEQAPPPDAAALIKTIQRPS